MISDDAITMDEDEVVEEFWAKRFPRYCSELEIDQLDEFYILHRQFVPGQVVPCCVDCAEIVEISALAVDKLNNDRAKNGMPLLHFVKINNATKQNVSGKYYHLQMLLKLTKSNNDEQQNCPLSPIYLFKIYRDIQGDTEIKYEEITIFANVPGGRWQLSTGNFMPKIGLQCSPNWSKLEAEQWILVALEAGFRLFDTTFFGHNRGQISKAIKKFLPLFGLKRTDVFISAKINIVRPETAKWLFRSTAEIDSQQFHSVSDYAHFCVEQCIDQFDGYIDLCMVHYAKDLYKNVSNMCSNNKDDREAVYGVLEHYMDIGTVRSIGVANFDSDQIERLIKDGKHCVPAVVQCEMHPFLQRDDLLDYCKSKGIFLQAHSIFAYKVQQPSYIKQHRRYSLLKNVASFYKMSTSQLSLSYTMQRAPNVGAVIVEEPYNVFAPNAGSIVLCQEIRKTLNSLMSSSVCSNGTNNNDEDGICQQQQQLHKKHMNAMKQMDMGKLDGRFTNCEQWKVM